MSRPTSRSNHNISRFHVMLWISHSNGVNALEKNLLLFKFLNICQIFEYNKIIELLSLLITYGYYIFCDGVIPRSRRWWNFLGRWGLKLTIERHKAAWVADRRRLWLSFLIFIPARPCSRSSSNPWAIERPGGCPLLKRGLRLVAPLSPI